jgi:hypothetical protein
MDLRKWSQAEVRYGRKMIDSGLEGARAGEEEFLHGRPLTPFVGKSIRAALIPAAIGACVGLLGGLPVSGKEKTSRMLYLALFGGAIGFSAGLAWESRRITKSATQGALENIHKVRDEHWVEKHPVAYA